MPACCTYTRPNGQPCRADALPDSPRCLFHDPRHQDTLAEARSKGGAAPRRRSRRLPPILDHLHVAQLLSELLVDAVNETDPANPRQLQAVTGLSRALLKAVGVPTTFVRHADRSEPPPTGDHLLRLYAPRPDEDESIADSPETSAPNLTELDHHPTENPPARLTELLIISRSVDADSAAPADAVETRPESPAVDTLQTDAAHTVEPPAFPPANGAGAETGPEQGAEQGMNRAWTGLPATEHFSAAIGIIDLSTEPAADEDLLWFRSRHPPPGHRASGLPQALGNTRRRPWVDPFW